MRANRFAKTVQPFPAVEEIAAFVPFPLSHVVHERQSLWQIGWQLLTDEGIISGNHFLPLEKYHELSAHTIAAVVVCRNVRCPLPGIASSRSR